MIYKVKFFDNFQDSDDWSKSCHTRPGVYLVTVKPRWFHCCDEMDIIRVAEGYGWKWHNDPTASWVWVYRHTPVNEVIDYLKLTWTDRIRLIAAIHEKLS